MDQLEKSQPAGIEESIAGARYWRPRFWPTWILLLWMKICAHVPIGPALAFHAAIGRVFFWLPTRVRSIVKLNLRLCFPNLPEAEISRLARRHFSSIGMMICESGIAWHQSYRHIRDRFEVVGLEHVHRSLAQGKGAILFTGHFTVLEICARPLKEQLELFVCMFSHRSNELLDELQRRGRERCAHESIPRDNVRALLDALKRNAAVWYAPDQAALGGSGVAVPFFAERAMMTTATSRLARISGAPLVPFSYRRKPGTSHYRLEFRPALTNFPGDDVLEDTRRLSSLLESIVREAPEQYFWIQKKFRGRTDVPDPYARLNRIRHSNRSI